MKRMHVHVAVKDLLESIRFYSALFAAPPGVVKLDYANWMLDDPRVNFAISTRSSQLGLDHLGIQAENDAELQDLGERLVQAQAPKLAQNEANCCYAKSNKYWTLDPQGIAWESFHSLSEIPVFGSDTRTAPASEAAPRACCAPAVG